VRRHRINVMRLALSLTAFLIAALPLSLSAQEPEEVRAEIQAVLNAQAEAWNEGDLDGFMAHYRQDESLRFASGNEVRMGWQTVMDRYRQTYGDLTQSGALSFKDLDIEVLSDDAAVVFGRFLLQREEGEDPTGLFTLLLRKEGERWVIVHDHTSS
jgi:uncharacterized protein (TIGR02246 family)